MWTSYLSRSTTQAQSCGQRSKSLNNASTDTAYIQSVVANLSSCSNDLSVKKILQYGALFSSQSVSLEHVSPYLTAPIAAHNTNKCNRNRACRGNRSVCAAAPAICPWSSAAEAASLMHNTGVSSVAGLRGYVRLCVYARAHTHEPTQTHERARARARGCLFWATCWFRCHDLHLHVHQGEICGARSRRGVETSSRAIRVGGSPSRRMWAPQQADTRARTTVTPRRGKVVHHREGRWCITGHTSVLSTRPNHRVCSGWRECGIQVDYYNTRSKNSVQNVDVK